MLPHLLTNPNRNRAPHPPPIRYVYDYITLCEDAASTQKPECLKYRCDLEENTTTQLCDDFYDFCDANYGRNWDLPQCTPPCELLDDPDTDARCREPASG